MHECKPVCLLEYRPLQGPCSDSSTLHPDLENATTSQGKQDTPSLLTPELQLLASAASDRAEMHSILAQQQENWNKLFQRTLTSTNLVACVLSGLATASHNVILCSMSALLLNAGIATMMAVINKFQPSQMAQEQRTVARLFHKLANDIHSALQVSLRLRPCFSLEIAAGSSLKRRMEVSGSHGTRRGGAVSLDQREVRASSHET
ncbi:hypothetical protein L7F22_064051 [Adiantum nelumboides]|nr:hypothetical protein [Adiantum nelumboides]